MDKKRGAKSRPQDNIPVVPEPNSLALVTCAFAAVLCHGVPETGKLRGKAFNRKKAR